MPFTRLVSDQRVPLLLPSLLLGPSPSPSPWCQSGNRGPCRSRHMELNPLVQKCNQTPCQGGQGMAPPGQGRMCLRHRASFALGFIWGLLFAEACGGWGRKWTRGTCNGGAEASKAPVRSHTLLQPDHPGTLRPVVPCRRLACVTSCELRLPAWGNSGPWRSFLRGSFP